MVMRETDARRKFGRRSTRQENQARKVRWTYDLTIQAQNLAQVIPVYTSPSQVL